MVDINDVTAPMNTPTVKTATVIRVYIRVDVRIFDSINRTIISSNDIILNIIGVIAVVYLFTVASQHVSELKLFQYSPA